jgi:hypothetical protein
MTRFAREEAGAQCAIDISSAASAHVCIQRNVHAIDAPSTAGCCSAARSLAGSRDRGMILSRLDISCSMQSRCCDAHSLQQPPRRRTITISHVYKNCCLSSTPFDLSRRHLVSVLVDQDQFAQHRVIVDFRCNASVCLDCRRSTTFCMLHTRFTIGIQLFLQTELIIAK